MIVIIRQDLGNTKLLVILAM